LQRTNIMSIDRVKFLELYMITQFNFRKILYSQNSKYLGLTIIKVFINLINQFHYWFKRNLLFISIYLFEIYENPANIINIHRFLIFLLVGLF